VTSNKEKNKREKIVARTIFGLGFSFRIYTNRKKKKRKEKNGTQK